MNETPQQLCDYAWEALGASPVRRYLLGRERADRLVTIANYNLDDRDVRACGPGPHGLDGLRWGVERRVAVAYRERCGFAFTTLVLYWAISTIVQALIARWWKDRK